MQPDPLALRRVFEIMKRPESLGEVQERAEELIRAAGLRRKGNKVAHFAAGDPDFAFGSFDANYQGWIRRGTLLMACDENGRQRLYVLTRGNAHLVVSGGAPHPDQGAVEVTSEPGPWWSKVHEEIPRIEAEFARLRALADEAATAKRNAADRQAELKRLAELGQARRAFARSGRSGCMTILFAVGAIAAAGLF